MSEDHLGSKQKSAEPKLSPKPSQSNKILTQPKLRPLRAKRRQDRKPTIWRASRQSLLKQVKNTQFRPTNARKSYSKPRQKLIALGRKKP